MIIKTGGFHANRFWSMADDENCVIRRGQLAISALIRLMMPGSPVSALALFAVMPSLADPRATKILSADTGSARCGSGVTIGVGCAVGEGDGAAALAQATATAATTAATRLRPARERRRPPAS